MSEPLEYKNKWYNENRDEFLKNKRIDYTLYYKYYYKTRILINKYKDIIPRNVLDYEIVDKDDYRKKYLYIREIIDDYEHITNDEINSDQPKRRTYKKKTNEI